MSDNKKWERRSHLFGADEYVCPYCGFVTDKPKSVCPHCKKEIAGVKSDLGWVDEAEIFDIFGG